MKKIFKAEAQGDVLYIEAESLDKAEIKLQGMCGPIPSSMIAWREVSELPPGQELMADPCDLYRE